MDEEGIIKEWCLQVRFAWVLAKGERLGELTGKRIKRFDNYGLHPYSQVVGHVMALQNVLPTLRDLDFDPVLLRLEAAIEAEQEFRMTILEQGLGQGHRNKRRADTTYDRRRGAQSLRDLAFE